jgi:hypothetical protein
LSKRLDFYDEQEYRHIKLLDYEFGPLTPKKCLSENWPVDRKV